MTLELPPLPPAAQDLCQQLNAPPRLVVHLQFVHEAAEKLIDGLIKVFQLLENHHSLAINRYCN